MKIFKGFILLLSLILFGCSLFGQNTGKWYYGSGKASGYAESIPESSIYKVAYDEFICDGSTMMMSVLTRGGDLFSYEWYEAGKASDVKSRKSFFSIPNCVYTENGKKYLCKVTDLRAGKVMFSDTVVVKVIKFPDAKIINPVRDTILCNGTEMEMEASPVGDEYVYAWDGKDIVGSANGSRIFIQPTETGVYKVTVGNRNCSKTASVQVAVNSPEVNIPDVFYMEQGVPLTITPAKKGGEKFNWLVGTQEYRDKNSLTITGLTKITTVVVQAEWSAGCMAVDSAVIIPDAAFLRYGGGDDDGFVQSRQKLQITGVKHTGEVCRGESAYFKLNVDIKSTYSYEWWKVGTPNQKLGTERMLTIDNCDYDDSGEYFCICRDLDTKEEVKSPNVSLEVKEIPTVRIELPKNDTLLCLGERVRLSASALNGDDEQYTWTGYNILTASNKREITVAPTETTEYMVIVDNGVCRNSAKVTVDVKKMELEVPAVLDIFRNEQAILTLPKEDKVQYTWSIDGVTETNSGDFTYRPSQSTMLKITKRWNNGRCSIADSTRIYLKDFGVGGGDHAGDGYTESKLTFKIVKVEAVPSEICVGEETHLNIEVGGYDIYRYEWYKVEGSASRKVSEDKEALLSMVQKMDAGFYFCKVIDVRTGDFLTSNNVELKILDVPVAQVGSPSNGQLICYGTTINLQARIFSGEFMYRWDGPEILSDNERSSVTVSPKVSSNYELTVSNGVCSSQDYIDIVVNQPKVSVPEVLYGTGQYIRIVPEQVAAGASIEWMWEGKSSFSPIFYQVIPDATLVKVKVANNGCTVTDSTRVYIKKTRSYLGGNADGFIESDLNFRIAGVDYIPVICENTDVEFTVRVVGSGLYSYAWKKVGDAKVLSTERNLILKDCALALSGTAYYCTVSDLQQGKTLDSEEQTLTVNRAPKAKIGLPAHGETLCLGESVRLDARLTEDSKVSPEDVFTYYWEGENITYSNRQFIVDVKPTDSQVYTLRVGYEGCMDYDTITVNVAKPQVTVPSVKYVAEGEVVKLSATVANATTGAYVDWWVDRRFYPKRTILELPPLTESTIARAVLVDGKCSVEDSTSIYLRTNRFYKGGEDDGFMESCEVPVINTDTDLVLGCGGEDSVTITVNFVGSVRAFKWQKYDDLSGAFKELTAASHITGLGSSQLTINPVSPTDYGDYRCMLDNECGYVYSKIYEITDSKKPTLSDLNPDKKAEFCEGAKNAVLSIAIANKEDGVHYRWYKKNPDTGVKQQLVPAAAYDSEFLRFLEIAKGDDALYIAEAYNPCGTTMDSIRLTVIGTVKIAKQLNDTIVCTGTDVRMWVQVVGGAMHNYTLMKLEKDPLNGGTRETEMYSGTAGHYILPAATTAQSGNYKWYVKSACDMTVESLPIKLTVETPPVFKAQTPDTLFCIGSRVQIEAHWEDTPDAPLSNIKYSWEKVGSGTLYTKTNVHSIGVFDPSHTGDYICYAANSCPKVAIPDPITVGLRGDINVIVQPALSNPTYCEGREVKMRFAVDKPAEVDSVRWFKGNTPVKNVFGRITGADGYLLQIDTLRTEEAGVYRAVVYSPCNALGMTTAGVTLRIDERAKFVKHIIDGLSRTTVCQGTEETFTVQTKGAPEVSYMWLCNNRVIAGATSNQLKVRFDSTATYSCYVVNHCGGEYSNVQIHVNKADTFRLAATNNGHYCAGTNGVELSLVGSDTNYVYRLYKDGATGENYTKQVFGLDAEFVGAPLKWGTYKKGKYRVVAKNMKSLCDFVMPPGELSVIEDTLPRVYNLQIQRPLCNSGVDADVMLTGSSPKNTVEYTLYHKGTDGWERYPKQVYYGTGDTLRWDRLPKGRYLVKAYDQETGCSADMADTLTLISYPNPAQVTLAANGRDTIYCEGSTSNAKLMVTSGVQDKITYTLIKDGQLTKLSDNVKPIEWLNVEMGVYSVEAKNEWGCTTVSGNVTIRRYDAPIAHRLSGGGYYCVPDVGTKEIKLTPSTLNIKYSLFKVGETVAKQELMGTNAPLVFNVPFETATYRVVAENTTTGCTKEMANRVNVKGGQMTLDHVPAYLDLNNYIEIQLELLVKDTIGETKVVWEPSDLDISGGKYKPWSYPVFGDGYDVLQYKATVTDSACTKSHTIDVILSGVKLTADIRKAGCVEQIPNDTLKVCKDSKIELCGYYNGGNGTYSFEWLFKGSSISTSSTLTNFVASTSGYLVYKVKSGEVDARDSIWIEARPLPGSDLVIANNGANCVAPGEMIKMELKNTTLNDSYSLEYSKLGSSYTACGVTAKGDATGALSLGRLFANEQQMGFYRVKISRDYGEQVCTDYKTGIETSRGTIKANVGGGGEYCVRQGADTIFVDTTEVGSQYRLICKRPGKNNYEAVFGSTVTEGNNGVLQFIGDWGNGYFRVVAERNSGCVDTMLNGVTILRHPQPVIGNLIADDSTFCKTGNLNVTIGISDCIAKNRYSLYREETAGVPILMGQSNVGEIGDVVFGTAFNEVGKYYVVADDGKCQTTKGFIRIALPPTQVRVSVADTAYCANESGANVSVKAFKVDHAISYKLYETGKTNAVGVLGGFNADTLYYKGVLKAGTYFVEAEIGTCRLAMDEQVKVNMNQQPLKKEIYKPLTACNGTPVQMGVYASQVGVRYEIWQHKEGVALFKTSAKGTGADLLVGQFSEVGKYTIMAVDTVTGCSRDSVGGVYEVLQAPKAFKVIAVDTVYCENPKNPEVVGAQIGISGSEKKKYYLQKYDELEGKYKDFTDTYGKLFVLNGVGVENDPIYFTGKFKAGKYRVRTEECNEALMSGVLEVKEQKLPLSDIKLNILGNGCVDSTFTVLLDTTVVGTTYTLYKGSVKVNGVNSIVGDANAQSWVLANLSGGAYRVEANINGCRSDVTKNIVVDSLPVIGPLSGDRTVMCQHDKTELRLVNWEPKATYALFRRPGNNKVADGKLAMTKDKILFESVGVGKFYAVGNRGDCKSYSPDYKIDSTKAPDIRDVSVAYTGCADPNKGEITVNNMSDTLEYELTWPGDIQKEVFFAITSGESKTFGNLGLGEYKLRVKALNGCFSLSETLKVHQNVPAGDTIIGKFGYCGEFTGAELTMASTTENIFYLLTNAETGVRVDSLYNSTRKVFRNKFPEGKYLFRRERRGYMAGCVLEDTVRISKYADPSLQIDVEVLGTMPLCAGNNYEIVVKNTENQVLYLLEDQERVILDTIKGDGSDLRFKPINKVGRYRILPKAGGVCGTTYLDTIVTINRAPAEVTAQACTYCITPGELNDKGCAIQVFGGSPNVKYVLRNSALQDLDTITGSILNSYVSFDPFPQGGYKIFGEDQTTKCWGLVDTVEIMKGTEPRVFTVGEDGHRCGNNIAVGTSDGSEGSVSDTVEYYLYRSGRAQAVAGPMIRFDGGNIEFPNQTTAGIYKIYALRKSTGCGVYMKDSVVIHKALVIDTLVATGSYCENTNSGLQLMLDKTVDEWRYYLQKDGVSSDTLKGQEGVSLMWSSVNGNKIRAGVYKLYAMTACDVSSLMDTIAIDTNRIPVKQVITGGDRFLCENESYTVSLDASQSGVRYDLTVETGTGTNALGTKPGTGGVVSFGNDFKGAGVYRVTGTNIATGCWDTVATMKVRTAPRPQDPGVLGENVCLDAMTGRKLTVRLNDRDFDNQVTYYLRRIHGADTTIVDKIDGTSLDPDEMFRDVFADQRSVGYYDVIAESATCREVYPEGGGFRIGNVPILQSFTDPGTKLICNGDPVKIELGGSEKDVVYTLYVTHNVVDPDTVSLGVVRRGTGSRLLMDTVYSEGIYLVKASSGCEILMPDQITVTYKPQAKLELLAGGYDLCQGDSTQIDIMGETDTGTRASYLVYEPGKTTPDRITVDGTGASIKTPKYYKTSGYYQIRAVVPNKCARMDSVQIREKALPTVFDVQSEANAYLCGDQVKKIKLSGQQIDVQYSLYRQSGSGWEFRDVKDGGREIVFELNQAGTYIVRAKSMSSPACEQQMNGTAILLDGTEIRQIKLEAVKGSYCDNPGVTEKGKVRLVSSDLNIQYQLLKDGLPFGLPQQSMVAGAPIVWEQLEGGMPRDSRFPTRKVGIDYTVVARDMVTGCPQDMLGIVNIVAERNIEFDDSHFVNDKWCCVGDKLTLDIPAYGGNITYTWKKDGVQVQSGLNSFYLIGNAQPSDNGNYKCILQNSCSIDSTAVVKVKPRLLVDQNDKMRDTVFCNLADKESRKVELRSDISNATTYKWEKDGVEIPGAKTSFLEVTVNKQSPAAQYVCIASNECGTLRDTAMVTVDSVPQIKVSKLRVDTLCNGSDHLLSVVSSAPVQWYQGNTALNEFNNSLLLPAVKRENAGVYFVESKNGCGNTRAQVGTLWVDDTIKVTGGSPALMSTCSNEKITLFITTEPTERVSYRWENAGGDLLGNTRELKDIDLSKITGSETRFRVIYSNKCTYGFKETKVILNKSVEFDTNYPPHEIIACSGSKADTMLWVVLPNGDKNVTFKWYFHAINSTVVELPEQNDTIRINLNTKSTGSYYCKVGSACGDTISRVTWVSVDTIVELKTQLPKDTLVCSGSKVNLSLTANGGGLLFRWKVLKPGALKPLIYNERPLLGSDICNFELVTSSDMTGTKVWCEIANSCSDVVSDTMILNVRPPVEATIEGGEQICAGDAGKVIVTLTHGTAPWSYKYEKNGIEVSRTNIAALADTLMVTEGGSYELTWIKDSYGCQRAGELGMADLEVVERAKVSMQLVGNATVCPAGETALRVTIESQSPGPWKLEIRKQSDSDIASDIIGSDEAILTYKKDTTFRFNPLQTEQYYPRVKSMASDGFECEGETIGMPIEVVVQEPVAITANSLTDAQRTFGKCHAIDLKVLFNAQPDNGQYLIGKHPVPGGSWVVQPGEEKQDTIGYKIVRNGCPTVVELGKLFFVERPKASIELERKNICPSIATKVILKATGAYPIDMTYVVTMLNRDGSRGMITTHTKQFTAADTVLELSASYQKSLSGMVYEIINIQDKHRCSPIEALKKDTVHFRMPLEYVIESKTGAGAWRPSTEVSEYKISSSDSVDVRVRFLKGQMPWTIEVMDIPSAARSFSINDIRDTEQQFALKGTGLYSVKAVDSYYCWSNDFSADYLIQSMDTAFVKLTVLLEGPWQGAKMESQVESLIDKRGLTSWPATGGRAVIDWVTIEVWSKDLTCVASSEGILLEDGTVIDRKGRNAIALANARGQGKSFHVAVRHRNHLAGMTIPINLSSATKTVPSVVDFTRQSSLYYSTAIERHFSNVDGKWMLSAGEVGSSNMITMREPNENSLRQTTTTTSQITTAATLDLDVNFNGQIEWPGWGGNVSDLQLDWVRSFKNRNKFSDVPEK